MKFARVLPALAALASTALLAPAYATDVNGLSASDGKPSAASRRTSLKF
jgi:hypothetical protein